MIIVHISYLLLVTEAHIAVTVTKLVPDHALLIMRSYYLICLEFYTLLLFAWFRTQTGDEPFRQAFVVFSRPS
jgi:hypothetical protein